MGLTDGRQDRRGLRQRPVQPRRGPLSSARCWSAVPACTEPVGGRAVDGLVAPLCTLAPGVQRKKCSKFKIRSTFVKRIGHRPGPRHRLPICRRPRHARRDSPDGVGLGLELQVQQAVRLVGWLSPSRRHLQRDPCPLSPRQSAPSAPRPLIMAPIRQASALHAS